MKKIIPLLLIVLCLTGCAEKEKDFGASKTEEVATPTIPAEIPDLISSFDIYGQVVAHDCRISMLGYSLFDFEEDGPDIIIFYFGFENYSYDTLSLMNAADIEIFQNDTELIKGAAYTPKFEDTIREHDDIVPGQYAIVECGYNLINDIDPVQLKVYRKDRYPLYEVAFNL